MNPFPTATGSAVRRAAWTAALAAVACAALGAAQLVVPDTAAAKEPPTESPVQRLFAVLFPFGPGLNAILATAYISGPPNVLLALIPPSIDPSSLSVLVSFAVGGLLGDVFFHLLPQTFLGEGHDHGERYVLVEEHKNTLLGVAIFLGFGAFIALDKTMRIFGGEGEHSHSHAHAEPTATTTAVAPAEARTEPRRRTRAAAREEKDAPPPPAEPGASVKLSAYLNLIADFTHNITDGLAIAASFYVSPNVGATTTLAVFFHEIPHEVGDFALLIQGGFSKSQAMGAQFVTAIGAFLGTFIGIGIQYLAGPSDHGHAEPAAGLLGTTCQLGDLVLPFTAGGFLYIATVGVIPEILEVHTTNKWLELRKSAYQALAMLVGAAMMFIIAWTE
ncbi:putative zip zinc transporter protein [Dipodascopsis tothii]|uniref:putative zip zinc transporter protein n=1 Tax=Dipodascopsis tothii TaxID=44089 RepID=UPI0034CECF86